MATDTGAARSEARRARRWIRVQAASGLVFLFFLTAHLINTALAAAGPGAYDGYQRVARVVYQFPLVELAVVLVPLVVHVVAGVVRILDRRKLVSGRVPRRLRLHRLAGYFLLLVIVGHVIATRGPSLARGIYPEFAGLHFSFQVLPLWFYPYYVTLALAGLYHGLHGATVALPALGVRVPEAARRGPAFWAIALTGSALLVLGVLGLGGVLFDVPDASSHPFARLGAELLGLDLPD